MKTPSSSTKTILIALLSSLIGGLLSQGVGSLYAQQTALPANSIPAIIPYQGRLESGGHPVSAMLDMKFTLHNKDSGATHIVNAPQVEIKEGFFSQDLAGFPTEYLRATNLTVSVEIKDPQNQQFVALQGEQRIMPALYAYNAAPSYRFDAGELAARIITTNAGVRIEGDTIDANITKSVLVPKTTTYSGALGEPTDRNIILNDNSLYNALMIVGGGDAAQRQVSIYDNLTVSNDVTINGKLKLAQQSFDVYADAQNNHGPVLMTDVASSICFLTRVWTHADDNNSSTSECLIDEVAGKWRLSGRFVSGRGESNCQARCLSNIGTR